MFPLFQGDFLRQSLISETLQSRMVALFILPVWVWFSCAFTFKVCRRTERVFFFLNIILFFWKMHLGFPSERSFKNPQQWSKTKTGDVANLAKPTTVNVQHFTAKVQLIFFSSQPSSEPCLPFDTLKSISPRVSYQMCNDSWALSLQVRWSPRCGSSHLWRKSCVLYLASWILKWGEDTTLRRTSELCIW